MSEREQHGNKWKQKKQKSDKKEKEKRNEMIQILANSNKEKIKSMEKRDT